MEVKPSDSLESINTRSGTGSGGRPRQTNSRSRQGTPQSRQSTPQPRQGTPQSRYGTPHSRQSTPQLRHGAQRDNQKTFDEYATIFDVQQGLKKGQLVEGVLRINPKSYRDAYISAPDGLTDIYVGGVRDRNRGLHGDVVAVQLRPHHEWNVSENALVTHLVSNGTQSDLETLYETDANLQKHAAKLEEILPDRFPRPLSVAPAPGRAAGASQDAVTSAGGPGRAVLISDQGDEGAAAPEPVMVGAALLAAGRAAEPDSGAESDDVLVEAVTLEPAAGSAEETGSTGQTGKTELTGPAEQIEEADQTGENEETGQQKTRRGTRAGRGRRRRSQESVAARLSRAAPPADQLAALSLDEPQDEPDEVRDERRDREDAPGHEPAATSAKRSCSSVTNPGAASAPGQPRDAGGPAAAAQPRTTESSSCESVEGDRMDGMDGCTGESTRGVDKQLRDSSAAPGSDGGDSRADVSPVDETAGSDATPSKKRNRRPPKKNRAAQSAAAETVPVTSDAPSTPGQRSPQKGRPAAAGGATPGTPGQRPPPGEKQEDGSALGVTVERALKHPEWGRFVQRTAKVVHILEAKHPRCAVGELRQFPDGSRRQAMFAPRDHRVPRLKVAAVDCPPDFFQQPQLYARTLFMAQITEWTEPGFAKGQLSRLLGETGSVDVEMEAILLEYGVDTREFGPQDLAGLPTAPWTIPPEEISRRRDLRRECIFTIDPLTARDLDDAVSCRDLGSGQFEVGVHIADVSYFLQPDVPADLTAAQRCNSVYLVHKVIPMLPRVLCEDLCSLNPAQDRLAFSAIWTLDSEGRVFEEWFGRTVIRSCTKMAYEHAQRIIDSPDREPAEEELPTIDGGWSQQDIKQRVLTLHKMAQCMRQRRTDDGALRLDQPKLCFQLDGPHGAPTGFYTYHQQASNRLIEEFMLLANMAVAGRILRSFPQLSVLRRHTSPQEGPLADAARLLRGMGLEIDVETSGSMHDSLQAMAARWQQELSPQEAVARMAVVVNLLSRPMNSAEYFCSGVLTEAGEYRHYALSVPLYTHFTSPIRRYPDVLVHRLLSAALKYDRPTPLLPNVVQRICVRCNEKKLSARLCSEACSLLFLAHMVDLCGPVRQPAIVMAVLDKSFDVFIPEMAISRRVYIDKLDVSSLDFTKAGGVPRLRLFWRATETEPVRQQVIELFSPVTVSLESTDIPLKFSTVALRPGTQPEPEPEEGFTSPGSCVLMAEAEEV